MRIPAERSARHGNAIAPDDGCAGRPLESTPGWPLHGVLLGVAVSLVVALAGCDGTGVAPDAATDPDVALGSNPDGASPPGPDQGLQPRQELDGGVDDGAAGDHAVLTGSDSGGTSATGKPFPPAVSGHPATVINQAELAIIRDRVGKKQQPQWAAYQSMLKDANDALSFNKSPPQTIPTYPADKTTIARAIFQEHSKYAYASALAYQLTGDTKYAQKAVAMLQKWQTLDVTPTSSSAGLHTGSYLVGFMYAYDLLAGYAAWSDPARQKFRQWWRDRVMSTCRKVVTSKMSGSNTADWDPSNWLEAALNCLLATGVAFDDKPLRAEIVGRVEDYFVNGWRYSYKNYGPGGKQVGVVNGDIDRIKSSSQRIQGVMYTGYGTSSMVQMMEMCRYAGVDLWNAKTPKGVSLKDVIEQWFRWNWKGEEFHHCLSQQAQGYEVIRGRTIHQNIMEIANSRYTMSAAFTSFLNAHRPIEDVPRDEYSTLTKGDMP